MEWRMANVNPWPKSNPPVSIENDIRPISLTPIAAKGFESITKKWGDEAVECETDAKQFGGSSGTSTTDVLVEMVHLWYIVMLDVGRAFDLINHHVLVEELQMYGLPSHIVR